MEDTLIEKNLAELIEHTHHWHYSSEGYKVDRTEVDDVKETMQILIQTIDKMFDDAKEEIPLTAPFQPECKCEIVQNRDGILTIHYCQYHRGIAYVHNELVSISELIEQEYIKTSRVSVIDLLSFLDECKRNSLTGVIGKAGDENVGR